MKTFYCAVKDCINAHIRTYAMARGGEILPIKKGAKLKLDYYGQEEDHELLSIRVTEDGIVEVTSIVDGKRETDDFKEFSNEEMYKIATFFIDGE